MLLSLVSACEGCSVSSSLGVLSRGGQLSLIPAAAAGLLYLDALSTRLGYVFLVAFSAMAPQPLAVLFQPAAAYLERAHVGVEPHCKPFWRYFPHDRTGTRIIAHIQQATASLEVVGRGDVLTCCSIILLMRCRALAAHGKEQ